MIHGDDPSNKNGSPSGGSHGPQKPSGTPNVNLEWVDLGELSAPPRNPAGTRLKKLFDTPTPEAIAELSDILWSSEHAPTLSYFGYRLAQALDPSMAGLACEVIKRRSFACTSDLLVGLAQREYSSFAFGAAPIVAAPEFAEFRRLTADLAVSPDCHFVEREWIKHRGEIITLTTYPITILRRSAGHEVDGILLNAATRCGLDEGMNRRALDMLIFRESSVPDKRVLPDLDMVEIARASSSMLRGPFNKAQLFSLLGLWASKRENLPSTGECAIRDHLLQEWLDFKDSAVQVRPEEHPRIIEVVRLLRHFPDPVCSLVLKEAAEHPHAGIRIVAKFAQEGAVESALSDLRECLSPDADLTVTLSALRVFAQHISPSIDAMLFPILDEYVQRTWSLGPREESGQGIIWAQKVILLQGMVRRFFNERADSPFLRPIFDCVGTTNEAMANVAINTFVQAVQMEKIPPSHFYDSHSVLGALRLTIQILAQGVKGNDKSVEERQRGQALVSALEELFVMRGPAAYGFELVAEGDPSESPSSPEESEGS